MPPVLSGKVAIYGAGGPIAACAARVLKDHYTLRLTDVRPLPEIAAEGKPQSKGAPVPEVLPAPHEWRVVDVADISGDGKADILWRDTGTGQVVAWAMDGFHVDHYGVLATVDNTWKVINHHYDLA